MFFCPFGRNPDDANTTLAVGDLLSSDLILLHTFGRHPEQLIEGKAFLDWWTEYMLKIRPKQGGIKEIALNRAQQEFSRCCSRRNIVLKARQVGITTYVAARFFYNAITCPGTLSVQVAHNQQSAEMLFTIVQRFWNHLPPYMHDGSLVKSRSNVRQIIFRNLDSEYRVETADANAGRGMTIHQLHCSEVSRWPRGADETLAALRAAVVPDGQVVLESTPNGASGAFYKEWQSADENGYSRHFFPWWYEESYHLDSDSRLLLPLSPEEKELAEREGLNLNQIAWRRKHWSALRSMAAQEYAEDPACCFLVSGECVFELAAVEKAMEQAGKEIESRDNGRLLTWLPPQRGREYIIGVDSAGGGSEGDYACAQVIERRMGMQCAEWHGHFPPAELARRVVELAETYNAALIAVERNNHGHAVLARIDQLKYRNVFLQNGEPGWLTSAATRPAMIENMAAILAERPELFRSPRLLEECRTFIRHADGSSGAADGAHDDCVMAMAVALEVRRVEAGRSDRRVERIQ